MTYAKIPEPPQDSRNDYALIRKKGKFVWVPVATLDEGESLPKNKKWSYIIGGPVPDSSD